MGNDDFALHEYREPGVPTARSTLPESWSQEVSDLFAAQPGRWKLAATFLGGALQRRQSKRQESSSPASRRIMEELVLAKPHKDIPQLLTSFLRDQQGDPLLRQVQLAILDSSGFALSHHEALLQQVYNRLCWTVVEKEDSRETAARLLKLYYETSSADRPGWLRLAKGRSTGDVLTMGEHRFSVECLLVLKDCRIVSACHKAITVWNIETGEVLSISEGEHSVNCVAELAAKAIGVKRNAHRGHQKIPALPFFSQIPVGVTSLCDPFHQSRRPVDVLVPAKKTVIC